MSREQDIFWAALDRATSERSAFLDSACEGAPDLRARVDALLSASMAAGEFLNGKNAPVPETTGSCIDRYRLEERLGEGGFGVVYRARQEWPVRRTVALKIIKLGMDTRAVAARFEAERQALAMMDHPNIARVFDGGATDGGRPYFVMELVAGVPITAFCDERRLSIAARLEVFLQVCRAVHHAHQKGIIHRDLKPSNVLVALEEDRPVAKVIDFGIAKATCEPLTDRTLQTRQFVFVGTAAYMSPEQAVQGDIDTRSDIYSLGALLYELLSDQLVLERGRLTGQSHSDVQHAILHSEPAAPSQRIAALDRTHREGVASRRQCAGNRLAAELRGDLDRIVLKCLEKDRTRRYETTEELMRDITRFLRHEPVLARGATLAYRAGKFVRRHRTGVIAAAAGVVMLSAVGSYHAWRLAAERDRAQSEARKAAKVSELLTELLVAGDPFRTRSPHGILEASAARVREEFADQPDVRLEILNAVGRVYLRRGELEKARPILSEALLAGRALGRPDLRLAQTLSDLGVLRKETGDPTGAVPLMEEALRMRRLLRGNDHNEVAITLVELGRVYNALERLDQAEPLLREALAIRRKVLGEEHREVAVSLGDLAVLLWQKGDLSAAEPYFKESIAMHRRTVGDEHPNVGQSFTNLAQLKLDQGALPEAEKLVRDALVIIGRSFGEKHWRTARVLGHLGVILRRQGRLDEAAATLEQAWQMTRSALGPERPQTAGLAIDYGQVLLERGDAAAAESLLREGLRVQRMTYAENGWRIATTKSLLAGALLEQGRHAEAEPLLLEADRQLRDIPGIQGRETKPTRERLAVLQRLKPGIAERGANLALVP